MQEREQRVPYKRKSESRLFKVMLSVLRHPELAIYGPSKCSVHKHFSKHDGSAGKCRAGTLVPTLSCSPATSASCAVNESCTQDTCGCLFGAAMQSEVSCEASNNSSGKVVSVQQIYKEISKHKKSCALRLRGRYGGSIHLLQSHAVLSCIHTEIKTYMQNVQVFTGHEYQLKKLQY